MLLPIFVLTALVLARVSVFVKTSKYMDYSRTSCDFGMPSIRSPDPVPRSRSSAALRLFQHIVALLHQLLNTKDTPCPVWRAMLLGRKTTTARQAGIASGGAALEP